MLKKDDILQYLKKISKNQEKIGITGLGVCGDFAKGIATPDSMIEIYYQTTEKFRQYGKIDALIHLEELWLKLVKKFRKEVQLCDISRMSLSERKKLLSTVVPDKNMMILEELLNSFDLILAMYFNGLPGKLEDPVFYRPLICGKLQVCNEHLNALKRNGYEISKICTQEALDLFQQIVTADKEKTGISIMEKIIREYLSNIKTKISLELDQLYGNIQNDPLKN